VKYLKRVRSFKNFFCAEFTNGVTTSQHEASCFFLIMQDKGVTPAELHSHIKLGEQVDPAHDWQEIRRIAKTFTERRA
jgi:hypothetical protein